MQIWVRGPGLCKKAVEAIVEPEFTVHDVKELLCHGWCRHPAGSVSRSLGLPPPHVKLMLGCKEFDDASSLELAKITPGMTLDLCPCYLSSTQVYVQKDWDRTGSLNEPRFIAQPWTCQNGKTAHHLKQWVADMCGFEQHDDVAMEYVDGVLIDDDDFENWAFQPCGFDGGLVLTAFKYVDAIEPCPSEVPDIYVSAKSSNISVPHSSTSSQKSRAEYKDYAGALQASCHYIERGGA